MANWINRLVDPRKLVAVFGLIAVLVPIWFLVHWAGSGTYAPLFQEMEWGEVGSVTDQLESAGIKYRLEKGGTEVDVPATDLARARVLLAQEGHGVGPAGFELFDTPQWGMTAFTQRVTYRRALEGELARTIGRLRGVEQARVHLALPETNALRKLKRAAEAAVVVSMTSNATLSPDMVRGITYLVSNSVERLSSENVAVLDDSGRLLSIPEEGESVNGLSRRQLERQSAVEQHLSEKAEVILATVLGLGNARVQVSAVLNFEQVDRTVEQYDPDGQVIVSEERSETEAGGGTSSAGPATIFANKYQNSRSVERIVGEVGNIVRLTVAVLLSEKALRGTVGGNGSGLAGRLANLEALVRNAVGFDATRGDQVTVAAIPFEPSPVVDMTALPIVEAPVFDPLALVERFGRPIFALLGILVTFLLARRALQSMPAMATTRAALAPAAGALPAPAEEISKVREVPAVQQLRREILGDTENVPETTAQVVRAWMAED